MERKHNIIKIKSYFTLWHTMNVLASLKMIYFQHHLPSLFPVSDGTGMLAFFSACILAASFALAVKAVWGTSLGMRGISRLPSISHSDIVLGPEILQKQIHIKTIPFLTFKIKWPTYSISKKVLGTDEGSQCSDRGSPLYGGLSGYNT